MPTTSAPAPAALNGFRAVLGVEHRMFYINAAIAVIFAVSLRSWRLAIINVVLHLFAILVTRKDPDLFKVYMRYRLQADYYRAWVSPRGWLRNRRPVGFNRL